MNFLKKIKKIRISKRYKKYLPSSNFIRVVGSGAGFMFVVFLIFGFGNSSKNFFNSKKPIFNENTTVSSLLQTDTDSDGVYDWEEALWGTDINKKASFNDIPDSVFIEQRKSALGVEGEQNNKVLNETDQFAREFFASYLALKTAGQDQETINKFSQSLGEKINNTKLVDVYSEANIKTAPDNDFDAKKDYYLIIQAAFEKYRELGIGDELDIVNKGLLSYTQGQTKVNYDRLKMIGQLYQEFAKIVIDTKVPKSYTEEHLSMANTAHNTGTAVLSMANVIDDPLVGLTGLNQYDLYSEDFIMSVKNLEDDLLEEIESTYGINEYNTTSNEDTATEKDYSKYPDEEIDYLDEE